MPSKVNPHRNEKGNECKEGSRKKYPKGKKKKIEKITKNFTSGAGLPASTVQENSASSPSFTTSFSGLTLITGFTGNRSIYKKV